MKEVILCKYGEVILKGANRSDFEAKMLKQLRQRARRIGNYNVFYSQSTVYIEPLDEAAIDAIDDMYDQAKHVFGFVGVSKAVACEKNIDTIISVAKEIMPERLRGYKTFKVEAKRSDKRFPMTSPEIAGEVGGAILSCVATRKHLFMQVRKRVPAVFLTAQAEEDYCSFPVELTPLLQDL